MANGNINFMTVSQKTLENSGSTQDLLQFISNASRQIKSVLKTVETTQPIKDIPNQVNLSSPVPSPTPSMSSTGSYEVDLLSLEPPRYSKSPPPYEFIQSNDNNARKRRHFEIEQNNTTKKRTRQSVEPATRITTNGDVYNAENTIMRNSYRAQMTPLSQHQLLGMLTNTNLEYPQHVSFNSKVYNTTNRNMSQLGSQGNLYQPERQHADNWSDTINRQQSRLYEIQHEQQQQHLYRNMNEHLKQLQIQQQQQRYIIEQQNQFQLLQQQQQLLAEEQKLQQQQLYLRKENQERQQQQKQQQITYVSNPEIEDLLSFIDGEELLTDDTIADFLLSEKINL